MKTFLYLIQAESNLPFKYRHLKSQSFVLRSYLKESKQTHIYAPNTTWTQGRNLLYEYVKTHNLNYDYYIFLDQDLVFEGLSQKQGFATFESVLESVDFPIVTPRIWDYNCPAVFMGKESHTKHTPKIIQKKWLENLNWELQTVDWFDGAFNAISHQAFFANTILPYTEKYDSESWWDSEFIFILKANYYYRNRIVQFNKCKILNTESSSYPRKINSSRKKIYADILNELGASVIEMSSGSEVASNLQLPNSSPLDKLDYMVDILSLIQPISFYYSCLRFVPKSWRKCLKIILRIIKNF